MPLSWTSSIPLSWNIFLSVHHGIGTCMCVVFFFLFRLICFCTMLLCITLLDFFYYRSARFFNHCWIMFLTTAFVFVLPLYYGFCAATLQWFLYYNMLLCQILFLCVLPQLFSLATGLAHINRAHKSCDQQ